MNTAAATIARIAEPAVYVSWDDMTADQRAARNARDTAAAALVAAARQRNHANEISDPNSPWHPAASADVIAAAYGRADELDADAALMVAWANTVTV